VEVLPQGGKDQLRHGYGMVSVPPSPKSREIYRRPWKAYTDKLLYHVERRLENSIMKPRTSSGDGADWIDSGSEEGGSEAGGEDGEGENAFVQRTKWLQDSFLSAPNTPTNNKDMMGYDDDSEDCNSEGWASEAANESYDGGNDRDVVGSWEDGTIWIGPKRDDDGHRDRESSSYEDDDEVDDEDSLDDSKEEDEDESGEYSSYSEDGSEVENESHDDNTEDHEEEENAHRLMDEPDENNAVVNVDDDDDDDDDDVDLDHSNSTKPDLDEDDEENEDDDDYAEETHQQEKPIGASSERMAQEIVQAM